MLHQVFQTGLRQKLGCTQWLTRDMASSGTQWLKPTAAGHTQVSTARQLAVDA
jgi:hypothetical protein